MAIYLQEVSNIVGGGKERYLEMLRDGWVPYAEKTRGMRLVWMGSTIGSTARWPETTALWELRDFEHYADVVARMYTDDTAESEHAEWWRATFEVRSRALTRTLVGTAWSPTLDDLRTRGIAGSVAGFESIKVVPGKRDEVLAALERRAAIDAPLGRHLAGAYEVAYTNDEAYAVWLYRKVEDCNAYQGRVAANAAIRAWEESLVGAVAESREYWGFSVPTGPLWPAEISRETTVW